MKIGFGKDRGVVVEALADVGAAALLTVFAAVGSVVLLAAAPFLALFIALDNISLGLPARYGLTAPDDEEAQGGS